MTEQEEDEELLSDLNQAKKTVISFDESPPYIKVCDLMLLKLEFPRQVEFTCEKVPRNSTEFENYFA